jgi:orotate phosphoribosyltransferase
MTPDDVLAKLSECGALLTGHFVLSSGRHSDRFLQLSVVLQHPRLAGQLCGAMGGLWTGQGIETVVGPAMGGIVIAYETARALGARALFTEREEGRMRLLRGFAVRPGERVLVVDDVLTTGGSVRDSVKAVRAAGATVAGVSVLVHRRSGAAPAFDVPYRPLAEVEAASYPPADCPLCRTGVAVTDPDKRTA